MKNFDRVLNVLSKSKMSYHEFICATQKINYLTDIFDVCEMEIWKALGLEVEKSGDMVELLTVKRDIFEQEFCIVDIETSGSIKSGQIIEIGAIKIKNFKEIARFESFIRASDIPQSITELTGICDNDLKDAPLLKDVLERFRIFLDMSVFVAHNVNFDYGFISESMKALGLGVLLNRKICTIDLARRTIPSERYGLGFLKEKLGIENAHHRALSDAISACEVFKQSLVNLPKSIFSVEELIKFSKNGACIKQKDKIKSSNEQTLF